MSNGNPLANLGELSRPASVLIEKISDAIGVLYYPTHLKRIAKAESEVEKIHAYKDIELSSIQKRTLSRLTEEECKKQENIENITAKATYQLEGNSDPDGLDEDWISHFFEKCRIVSDEEMQILWSKLLAGEANSPNSYSKRTIDTVSSLSKKDAKLFTKFCSFVLNGPFGVQKFTPLILDENEEVYLKQDIVFEQLLHLHSIGLIQYNSAGYNIRDLPYKVSFSYFESSIIFNFESNKGSINIGKVLLTDIGKELAVISGAEKNVEFLDYIYKYYQDNGYVINLK